MQLVKNQQHCQGLRWVEKHYDCHLVSQIAPAMFGTTSVKRLGNCCHIPCNIVALELKTYKKKSKEQQINA